MKKYWMIDILASVLFLINIVVFTFTPYLNNINLVCIFLSTYIFGKLKKEENLNDSIFEAYAYFKFLTAIIRIIVFLYFLIYIIYYISKDKRINTLIFDFTDYYIILFIIIFIIPIIFINVCYVFLELNLFKILYTKKAKLVEDNNYNFSNDDKLLNN